MNLLCCLPLHAAVSGSLLASLASLPSQPRLEVVHRTEELGQRLQQPRPQCLLCLAVLPSRAELSDLLSMEQQLQGIPLVLVLPDEEPATLSLAHRLRARYVTSLGRPRVEAMVVAVLERMRQKYCQPWEGQAEA